MTQAAQIDVAAVLIQAPDSSMHLPWIAAACVIVVLWVIGHASRKLAPTGRKP
jgi:hypothetical protein